MLFIKTKQYIYTGRYTNKFDETHIQGLWPHVMFTDMILIVQLTEVILSVAGIYLFICDGAL